MPSIQESFAMPIPAGVGQMLPGLCIAGVRKYMVSRLPENAVSAAPATPAGTTGASSSAPVTISAVESRRTNRGGGMGCFIQAQAHMQLVSALVDAGLAPRAALDRPRFWVDGPRIRLE